MSFQVVSGPMVDLVGGKRTMLVANIVAGASTLATPWLVSNYLLKSLDIAFIMILLFFW